MKIFTYNFWNILLLKHWLGFIASEEEIYLVFCKKNILMKIWLLKINDDL